MTANSRASDLNQVQLLTIDEAAEILRQHPKTLYRLVSAGEMPWVNIASKGKRAKIRFRLADLLTYVDARHHPASVKSRRAAA